MITRKKRTGTDTPSLRLEVGCEPIPGYVLRRFCGVGAFGQVWEAEDASGKKSAFKFLSCQNNLAPIDETQSIRMVAGLKHPNLIRTDKVCCISGYIVVVMELAEGSLHDLHLFSMKERNAPLKPQILCTLLLQAAEALDFLNARQHEINGQLVALQHCDVKPSNMLLVGELLKVSDFGLTAFASESMRRHPRTGTPEFMAPEIRQGRLSSRTDQFSLAVTYHLLRTGRYPFPSASRVTLFQGQPQPDLTILPSAEQVILARALSPRPFSRWPSCMEMMTQLERVIQRG